MSEEKLNLEDYIEHIPSEREQFEQDRFELWFENFIENSKYRTKVVLASTTDPGDIVNGLIFDCKLTLRLLEETKKEYKL